MKKIPPPVLTVEFDCLHIEGHLLLRVYPAGDCDTCPWPMPDTDKHRQRLACALFDARECDIEGHFDSVVLPDGTTFEFDQFVP